MLAVLLFNIMLGYICVSVVGYALMGNLYDSAVIRSLPNVRYRWLYYLLQFTWGLPMNIAGIIVALILTCCKKKAYRYGWNYCFELNVNFGLELGIFFIAPIDGSAHIKNHEHGHAIQNIYFGPFSIGMVSIPSVVWFWSREIQHKLGVPPITKYDDIWFEGQATKTGARFIETIQEKGEV